LTAPALTVLALLFGLLGAGIWVAIALMSVGIGGLALFRSMPIERVLGQGLFNSTTSPELLSLPLFVLMAEILFRTRMADMVLRGLAPWTAWLPGRLLHVNVLACTLFASVSGSSAATTATVGRITLSELTRRGYRRDLAIGSLAGAGTLGFLIPPSLIMIVYGVLAEVSIIKLFMAGVIPGLMLAVGFSLYLVVRALIDPSIVPAEAERPGWGARLRGLRDLGPVLALMLAMLGSMYGGIASPTEAAAIGVLGALVIAAASGGFTRANMADAFGGAVRTSSMIGLILAAASFLSVAVTFLGIPRAVAAAIAELGLSPFMLLAVLLIFYLLLGCVLDGLSAIVMTLPVALPLIVAAGVDKIWFGVFLVLVVEMAQITPPIGFNLFVLQGLTEASIWRVAYMAIPFLLVMIALTFVLMIFPEIVLFLPDALAGG
jgi:C4-dicarboxylate transporter, DctM subunit